MKKILLIGLAIMSCICMLVACKKGNVGFGKGKTMILEFETNPTTGYDWAYEFLTGDDKAVIECTKSDYEQLGESDMVGAPSKVKFYFKATKAGNQSVTFTYKRNWEGGDVAYDVVYELVVDKDLNISCLSKMKGNVESDVELSTFPNPTFE